MDVMRARDQEVRLTWKKEHVRYVGQIVMNRLSTFLYRRPRLLLALLLLPPLIWFVVVYLGALAAMLLNSFFSLDGFTGQGGAPVHAADLCKTPDPHESADILPHNAHGICVTLACIVLRFRWPTTWRAIATPRLKTLLYLAVTLPLWSSYVVRVYSWKLILAQEGIVSWFTRLAARGRRFCSAI